MNGGTGGTEFGGRKKKKMGANREGRRKKAPLGEKTCGTKRNHIALSWGIKKEKGKNANKKKIKRESRKGNTSTSRQQTGRAETSA